MMAISKVHGKEQEIIHEYLKNERMVKSLAEEFGITTRTIQRLAEKLGVSNQVSKADRQATAWKTSPALKADSILRSQNKRKRITIPLRVRFEVLQSQKICQLCGAGKESRLQIDHIDENPSNNNINNLRVLCDDCNLGNKTWLRSIYGK
jgi:hypothetical protein